MEAVPNTIEEVLAKLGDYAFHAWMKQIEAGEAHSTDLGPEQAMLVARLIELSEEGLRGSK